MHVVHAGRAGRHAGEAGEAAVDVLDDLGRSRPVVLQHVLDQVDAPARANRARRRAAHRSGRSRCRSRNARRRAGSCPASASLRIGELARVNEVCIDSAMSLLVSITRPARMRPGLSTPLGSKLSFTRLVSAASARLLRLKHVDRGADRGTARGPASHVRRVRAQRARTEPPRPPRRAQRQRRPRPARPPSHRTSARPA